MAVTIAVESPLQDDVRDLIAALNAHLLELTPPEFCSHLTVEQMADADTTVLIARDEGAAVACGALRRHGDGIGEVKRMYTLPSASGSAHRRRHPGADRGAGPRGRPHAARARDGARPRCSLARLRARRLHALRPGARLSALGLLDLLREVALGDAAESRPGRATSERTAPPAASRGTAREARSRCSASSPAT